MTPKEKALELFETFQSKSPKMSDYSVIYIPTALLHAKKCVDEILKYSKAHGFIELTEYYEDVQNELDKL